MPVMEVLVMQPKREMPARETVITEGNSAMLTAQTPTGHAGCAACCGLTSAGVDAVVAQAMAQLKRDLKVLHEEQKRMVAKLRTCNPPASSLGAHLLALKDPATGRPLTDAQLEAELVTFFFAGPVSTHAPWMQHPSTRE